MQKASNTMTVSAIARKPAVSFGSVLTGVYKHVADLMATVAAAGAVSAALENRRQPNEADLRQLGLEGAKFNLKY